MDSLLFRKRLFLWGPVLFLLLSAGGCKRAPRTWTLDGGKGFQVRHVQPKVRAGQKEIPLELALEGQVPRPPRLVWTPGAGGSARALSLRPLGRSPGGGEARFEGKLPFLGPGKRIRYHFLLEGPEGKLLRFPPTGEFEVTCKGAVSPLLLLAHISGMFLGLVFLLLVAFRCLVYLKRGASLLSASRMVKWATFFIFLGGLPLGMLVERKVFGTWWEGWPFGRDVTDTKTGLILVLWLALSFAAPSGAAPSGRKGGEKRARAWAWTVLFCLVFTVVLYAVPHENLKF